MEASEIQELAEITVKVDESRIAGFQKLAEEFGVLPKSPNVDFGTHFMMPNTDLEPPTPNSSNDIDGNISKSADGAICTCNVCGKILSCMSSARRHFKTTHEEIEPTPCPLGCGFESKNPTSLDMHLKNVHSVTKKEIK